MLEALQADLLCCSEIVPGTGLPVPVQGRPGYQWRKKPAGHVCTYCRIIIINVGPLHSTLGPSIGTSPTGTE